MFGSAVNCGNLLWVMSCKKAIVRYDKLKIVRSKQLSNRPSLYISLETTIKHLSIFTYLEKQAKSKVQSATKIVLHESSGF